ncbi:MAG: glycosyltransferase [Butyrivibrio sp.]|nr:glycosyltransferase [Butyrivibrio sp.]
MRILYYYWDEFNGEDCMDAMRRLGHEVDILRLELETFELTQEVDNRFKELLTKEDGGKRYYDIVYSFDYYPCISDACQKYDTPYVSWVFDCPHYTLDSHTINNPVNRVFVFDRDLYKIMKSKGVDTIHYSPLGVNEKRLSQFCKDLDAEVDGRIVYQHDVTFLGNLYDNEYNFYDQVTYLPPELKEYIDSVIELQEMTYGHDLFTDEKTITPDHVKRLREYIKFERTGNYDLDYDSIILDMLRHKVTVNERRHILERMGERFDTFLYTPPGAKPIPGVKNMGVADYTTKMPLVFRRSKVNLNITLRSILSGVSLRVIDILAAGGFLITTYQKEIDEYFEDGVDLVLARTPEEMVEKTAYYLEHEDERKEIAATGQKKVFENFAYTKLLPNILEEKS